MEELVQKAKNYFILARIAEKIEMYSESASNYFKALSAINDFMLGKLNFKAKDHSDRFALLKVNLPELYAITDKLFYVYRRTYTNEINKEEIKLIRKNVEDAFKNAKVEIPTDKNIEEKTEKLFKK